ncbi:helix-turn-helix domain-containing protein [Microbacterium mitrae]|uniref:ArsR family transcriptional regulator n=1 Tax=Microbacterium mitrae TaxID=664640 RepID=A0A5C8HN37_9MICO|nr:ArsR family transcriptional regulator [Microbacterium mitrae]TXK03033.1 ArsR family transcriptional regulator [Microbacterium mitrae]
MASSHPGYSAISSESRVQILHLLQTRPLRTIDELVESTGLHPNTVREHLQRLSDDGYIVSQTERRETRGRPRTLYSAATGDEEAMSPVAQRKVQEAAERGDLMRRVLPDTDNGDLNDDELHQIDALVENLIDSGFDPIVDPTDLTIDLSPCAHLGQADDAPTTRCAVHVTLLQAIVTQAGGPLNVDGLRPACNPQDCVIQLRRGSAAT